jgi:membrane protein insertase Oxa1/YidC/SpoIIIJ
MTLPIINFPIYGFNPLPILLAVVLFINMKVTMASQPKPADEQQAQMQKWSQYSIFMLPFFLYNAPSGSNLYFFASTMGGLVDTYFIRKSLKKRGILPPSAKDLPVEEPSK